MARDFFGIEKGLDIYEENGDLKLRILTAAGAPTATAEENAAPLGSLYVNETNGDHYRKVALLNAPSDWTLVANGIGKIQGFEVTGITTSTPVDSVPVATVLACKWLVVAFEEATPTNVKAFEVYAANNGTLVDDTVYAKLRVGSNFNLSLSVDISGGNMRLLAASTTAGVTVRARRIEVIEV